MTRRLLLATLLAVIVAGWGCSRPQPPLMKIGEFTLVDDRGAQFRLSSLRGRPALLFFGYTHCPDACPTMMSLVARAYKVAGPKAKQIPTLFVSVDPRDDPAVLRQYVSYFRAVPARGLTGTKEQIDAVVRKFAAHYAIHDTGSPAGPMIDHTIRLFLLDRNGDVVAMFQPGATPAQIAKAMKRALRS